MVKIKAITAIPPELHEIEEEKIKLEENYSVEEITSDGRIYPNLPRKIRKTNELPLRLYDVKSEDTKIWKEYKEGGGYGIISYFWGSKESNEALSKGGRKALIKAIEACKDLGIQYLWMDQLCINQENTPEGIAERNQEVPKMLQYYSNSTVTLIAINSNVNERILERWKNSLKTSKETNELDMNIVVRNSLPLLETIIRSEWFSRSWVFQEGLLSRETIFMFDNVLIDGRFMASIWDIKQSSEINYVKKYKNIENALDGRSNKKVATTVGWIYFREGYSSEDKVELSLIEALRAVKEKKRFVPIDGIYSILGLLPYGHKVKVRYKQFGVTYTKEELEQVLLDVMKMAVENGYGEPFAWHGNGNGWLPKIDEHGSVHTTGYINVSMIGKRENIILDDGDIKLIGLIYKIVSSEGFIVSEDRNSIVDGNLHKRYVAVEVGKSQKKVTLVGTFDGLKEAVENNELIIPNEELWKSNIPFAILVKREENNICHRIDLVRLENKEELLRGIDNREEKEREFIIRAKSDNSLDKALSREEELQIEIDFFKNKNDILQQELIDKKRELEKWKKEFYQLQEKLDQQQSYIQIPPKQDCRIM